ncbi:unnamed protein product [Symbiodinium natans]|uniref:Glycoside hydrolase family 5 domain-containing protein n=1 Tax=Symbiodinium natans TaxID=878477 RepID=A0A812QBN7_9DINO|nr:unnamed protein product [Symbiodinium natans]
MAPVNVMMAQGRPLLSLLAFNAFASVAWSSPSSLRGAPAVGSTDSATATLPGPNGTNVSAIPMDGMDGMASDMPPFSPLRAIAYGALPCVSPSAEQWAQDLQSCSYYGLPSEDMLQEGYAMQWGAKGRNDLGRMKGLGANAVRLYHSLGLESKGSHKGFLDRAHELKLNVMPGFHSSEPSLCDDFDCFEFWKDATLKGFEQGFAANGKWHPAVSALILMNEPDFFEHDPLCKGRGAVCRVKAVVSALDGLLAAEELAGVEPGRVHLTVTWSFAMRTSIDDVVQGPGTFGFQDMVAVMKDPSLVDYTPRTPLPRLQSAFEKRWVHGLNTQSPWSFVSEFVSQHYQKYDNFGNLPWFIGEYGANGQTEDTIISDLTSLEKHAEDDALFLGAAVFQFQTAYSKGGTELNFGLYSLGTRKLGMTGEVCDSKSPCMEWPVFCLSADLPWFQSKPQLGKRATAVATAWNGEAVADSPEFCS